MRPLNRIGPRAGGVSRAGGTLIEMLIVVLVLGLFVNATARMVSSGGKAYEQNMGSSALDTRARRAIDRIAAELTSSVRTTLTPNPTAPLGTESLQFRTCLGSAGGALLTSDWNRIELRRDPGDANNGVDDDGDGFVDEGSVVLIRDFGGATETETVLVRNVAEYLDGETANAADDNANGLTDERGLSFVVDANGTLTVRLTLAGFDASRRPVTRTVETRVHARN